MFHGIAVGCGLFFIVVSASLFLTMIIVIIFVCIDAIIVDIAVRIICIATGSVYTSVIIVHTVVISSCLLAITVGL